MALVTVTTFNHVHEAELAIGERFIEWLLRLFPIERIAAIGNAASSSLTRLGVEHVKVRHPSQGGKRKFVEGMARLSADV